MANNKFEVGFVFGAKKAASFDKTFKGISSSFAGVAKGIAGIAGAYIGFNGIKNAITQVVTQFGELEQNIGGAEAVFGEYAEAIQNTGAMAYKNLGVSQSEYLATANKMGALFQGSGVQQVKSLELTEKAMQRAADMASVMGIDMQVALDSVAGAAKGNFTMMDNLGVAMNATNIQAYALEKGMNFKWTVASQAEKAEVAMAMFFENTEQYAGNFAREATQTVSGSFGLLKASWSSFVAGLGNEKADMTSLTGNVVDAFKTVAVNVIPVIKNMAFSLPEAFIAAFPRAGPAIMKISQYAGSAFSMIKHDGSIAISGIRQKWDQYGPGIITFVMGAKDKAVSAFIWIKDTGQKAIGNIQAKFIELKPKIDSFIGSVVNIGGAFETAKPVIGWIVTEGLPSVIGFMGDVLGIAADVYYFFNDNWSFISPIVYGIVGAFAAYKAITLGLAIAQKAQIVAQEFQNVLLLKSAVSTGGLAAAKTALAGAEGSATVAQWGLNAAMSANPIGIVVVAVGALIAVGVLLYKNWDVIKAKTIELWSTFSEKFPMLAQIVSAPIEVIKGLIGGLKLVFTGIIDFVAGVFTGDWSRAWEGVRNIFGGIFSGLGALVKAPLNAIISLVNKAISGINSLNIDIPSWVPVVGGTTLGFSIPQIPMLATGGVATAPTLAMVGEGRESEAILPLSKLNGMMNAPIGAITSLLQRFMNAIESGGLGGGTTINYNQQLVFNGPTNKEDVRSVLDDGYEKFKQYTTRLERDKARTSLKPRK